MILSFARRTDGPPFVNLPGSMMEVRSETPASSSRDLEQWIVFTLGNMVTIRVSSLKNTRFKDSIMSIFRHTESSTQLLDITS